jgi:hypothetical protein
MKFSVGGHEYNVEWLATCTGLFLACAWLLILLAVNSGNVAVRDFISVAAFFGIGFSAVELLGAWEIYRLWHEETDALQAEAWRRYNVANREALEIGYGKVIKPVENPPLETMRQIVVHQAGQTKTIDAVETWTPEQRELGRALQDLFLWGAALGSLASPQMVGKEKPFSRAEDWGELTDYGKEIGLISKPGNGIKTELAVTNFAYALGSVFPRLSRVSVPNGWKAPKIAPPPPDAWDKVRRSERKGERSE